MAGFTLTLALVTIWTFAADGERRTVAPVHTSRKLAGAIDTYLKEVESAEKAKADAAQKLVATYEAAIKRAMRGGELRLVEELQTELKEIKGELPSTGAADGEDDFRTKVTAHPWLLFWDSAHNATYTFHPDGTVTRFDRPGAWRAAWKVERRWALILDGTDILLLGSKDRLFGFRLDSGKPVSGTAP